MLTCSPALHALVGMKFCKSLRPDNVFDAEGVEQAFMILLLPASAPDKKSQRLKPVLPDLLTQG
jgi:hypothetical protein